MSGRRHRSNCELVAQGVANIGSSLFGGMLHALFVLLFMLVAAPLASYIPLAALAGILAVVSWDMIEKPAIANLMRSGRGEAAVLIVTFLLTIFRDLTEAIVVGFALGSVLFIHRMSKATAIESASGFIPEDRPDDTDGQRTPYTESTASDPDVAVYKINGVFFFGAAASIGSVFDAIADTHKALAIDFSSVPFADSSAANTIEGLARKAHRKGVHVYLAGTNHATREEFFSHGLKPPHVHYELDVRHAMSKARQAIDH